MNNIYIFYKKDSNSGLMYILSSPPFRKTQQVFILYHRTGKLKNCSSGHVQQINKTFITI